MAEYRIERTERTGWLRARRVLNPRSGGSDLAGMLLAHVLDETQPRYFADLSAYVMSSPDENAGAHQWCLRGKAQRDLSLLELHGQPVVIAGEFRFRTDWYDGREFAVVYRATVRPAVVEPVEVRREVPA